VIVYGDCTVPDRTACVASDGPSPLPKLLAGVEFFNRVGVSALCVPCNTAHHWHAEMQEASTVPVLHIVRASVELASSNRPRLHSLGVLSTYGTHRMGIYRQAIEELGLEVIEPTEDEFETLVSHGIALTKANRVEEASEVFGAAADRLLARGAESVILGCTEIPLGMERQLRERPDQFVDSNEALARAVVAAYYGEAE